MGNILTLKMLQLSTEGRLIHWIGKQQQLPADTYSETVDLNGAWVTPGFIDCHTHSVFGGNRSVGV